MTEEQKAALEKVLKEFGYVEELHLKHGAASTKEVFNVGKQLKDITLQLTTENAALVKEIDDLVGRVGRLEGQENRWRDYCEDIKQERDRLRDALTEIWDAYDNANDLSTIRHGKGMAHIAKEALEGK